MREKVTLIHCWWECKLIQPLWKTIWRLLKKLKTELPYYLAIPLLRIYLKECKSSYNKDICTSMFILALFTSTFMFILALFTIDQLWKQSRCPTTDEWIKKMWYLYIMEFYSATKKNGKLSFAGKQKELENFILSEVVKLRRLKSSYFLYYVEYRLNTNTSNIMNTRSQKWRSPMRMEENEYG
jgi:hypothetical protein